MSQDLPPISLHALKGQIRGIVQQADISPIGAVLELRNRLEAITVDIYQRSQSRLPSSVLPSSIPDILQKKAKMTKALEVADILPHSEAKSAFDAGRLLNQAVHRGSATRDELVNSLTLFLHLLRWYEKKYPASPSIRLEPLQNAAAVAEKGAPYANTTVILAGRDPGSDIEEEWQGTRTYLANYGVKLVLDQSVEQSPPRDALFVQLFSALDPIEAAKRRLEKYCAPQDSVPVLQWRKTLPDQRIETALLNSLDPEEKDFCESTTVKTGSIEEFKQQLLNQLDIVRNPRDIPYLYIAFDRSNSNDDDYATKLNDFATQFAGAHVRLMPPKKKAKKDFVGALRNVSGFVFLYGDTDRSFIEEWIGWYIDGKRSLNPKLKLAAIFEAPPQNQEKKNVEPRIGLRADEWRKYGSRDQFVANDIERYCKELRR